MSTRLEVLEEAAHICDEYNAGWYVYHQGAADCANAIRMLALTDKSAHGAAPPTVGGVSQYIPGNFRTHRNAWRAALEIAINAARTLGDMAYWKHELAAYDRSFARLLDSPEPIKPQVSMQFSSAGGAVYVGGGGGVASGPAIGGNGGCASTFGAGGGGGSK